MKDEVWEEIDNFPKYEASNKGRIRSWNKKGGGWRDEPKLLSTNNKNMHGYVLITLYNENGIKTKSLSRIIGETFLEPVEGKEELNHKDGNKENNCVDNLEWCTRSENVRHAFDTGLIVNEPQNGSDNGMSQLTKNDVLDIRNAYKLGVFTHKEIAKAYDVSRRHIGNILQRKRWAHI